MTENIVPCDKWLSEMSGNRKMFIDCKNCQENFSFEDCLPGMILALEENYDIDVLVLSDYIEIQYSEENMEIFNYLRELSEDLSRFSFRKTDRDDCSDCKIQPKSMYTSLKNRLLTDHANFYQYLTEYALKVMTIDGCKECRISAKEEMTMLSEKVLELRSKVLLKAYGVLR